MDESRSSGRLRRKRRIIGKAAVPQQQIFRSQPIAADRRSFFRLHGWPPPAVATPTSTQRPSFFVSTQTTGTANQRPSRSNVPLNSRLYSPRSIAALPEERVRRSRSLVARFSLPSNFALCQSASKHSIINHSSFPPCCHKTFGSRLLHPCVQALGSAEFGYGESRKFRYTRHVSWLAPLDHIERLRPRIPRKHQSQAKKFNFCQIAIPVRRH